LKVETKFFYVVLNMLSNFKRVFLKSCFWSCRCTKFPH